MSCTILQINMYGLKQYDQAIIVSCNKCKSINSHGFGKDSARIMKEEEEVDDKIVKWKYKSLDFRNLGQRMCHNTDCHTLYYLYSK